MTLNIPRRFDPAMPNAIKSAMQKKERHHFIHIIMGENDR